MQKVLVSLGVVFLFVVFVIVGIRSLVLTNTSYPRTAVTVGYLLNADPVYDDKGSMTHVVFLTYLPTLKDTILFKVSSTASSVVLDMEKSEGISFNKVFKEKKCRVTGYISFIHKEDDFKTDLAIRDYKFTLREINS